MKSSTVFLQNHLAQTTLFPFALEIDSAKGIYIYDKEGKAYIDFISGIGVNHLGHQHPHIIDALEKQLHKHLHVMVYGEYLQASQLKAAKLLSSVLPEKLDTCYFVNSGTEANEAALKLAKRITGRTRIISFQGAYHGNTHGSLSVSSNESKKAPFRPLLPDVYFIRLNHTEDLVLINENVAAVILETVQGDAGVRVPTSNYLKLLRQKCDESGVMLILDEIQCGMGRTGTMFAFEQFEVVPDILTLGKALGGGLPVGCFISSQKNMKLLTHDPMLGHISTFAGHPLVCASVAATLEVFRDEKVLSNVEKNGKHIEDLLVHSLIKKIRRIGMFFAIEMENEKIVEHVVDKCLQKGLISFWFLSCPNAFRIAPPLNITSDEIERSCAIILQAMDETNQMQHHA